MSDPVAYHGLDGPVVLINGGAGVAVTNLLSREDPVHGQGTYDSGVQYQAGSATVDDGTITFGAPGALGDRLTAVTVRAAAVGGTVTVKVMDGATEIEAYRVTVADNNSATILINGGRGAISVNGAWGIKCDISAGTIGNVKYVAHGTFS